MGIQEIPRAQAGSLLQRLWRGLGPGLVTGAADDDPSGIATHSQIGAQFGYALSWTFVLSFPLMVVIRRWLPNRLRDRAWFREGVEQYYKFHSRTGMPGMIFGALSTTVVGHVWTAPGWQGLSSRFAALVGAAMCSAF